MTPVVTWGPLAISLAWTLAIAAVGAGFGAARWLGGRPWADVRPPLWRAAWMGVAGARVAFVLAWLPAYLRHPIDVLDLRDGGFDGPAGLAVACLVAIVACSKRPGLRRPFAVAFLAAGLVWVPGTIALLAAKGRGPRMPALALPGLAGPDVDLASFAGRPVVLNLWATWCPPCRREMPLLQAQRRAHPELVFVFVNEGEPRAVVARYLASEGLTSANVLLDESLRAGAAFGQKAYPTTLFFDASGRLVDSRVGRLDEATLARHLAGLAAAGR